MLLLWQHLITGLTLECLSLNDFTEYTTAENQGPGILFLIWILLFWEKGESLVSQKKLLLSHRVDFLHECIKNHNFFMLTEVDIWLSLLPNVTVLPPPGNIPENTVQKTEKNWFVFIMCWRRNIILTGGTSSLPDSPMGWYSLWSIFVRLQPNPSLFSWFCIQHYMMLLILITKHHSQERHRL